MPRPANEGDSPIVVDAASLLGVPPPPPAPPTAGPRLNAAPIVSSVPNPGQGVALDAAGKLPATVLQLQVGYQLAYTEVQSDVAVAATTEATATTVVTTTSVKLDGTTAIRVEFSSYRVDRGTTLIAPVLYDSVDGAAAASIGLLAVGTATSQAMYLPRIYTPAAGVHIYSVRAFVDAGAGNVRGGAGGLGAGFPTFLRITRA